jgi:hydroxyacylglutathione hydrolase
LSEIERVAVSMGGFEVNSYVVHAPEGDIIVDAGAEPGRILAAVRDDVAAVFVTHGHADHVGALGEVLAATNAPLYVHPDDAARTGVTVFEPLDDGEELEIAGESFLVLHTPGHSPGSVTFVVGEARTDQIVGDLILPGSVGRTDIAGA